MAMMEIVGFSSVDAEDLRLAVALGSPANQGALGTCRHAFTR